MLQLCLGSAQLPEFNYDIGNYHMRVNLQDPISFVIITFSEYFTYPISLQPGIPSFLVGVEFFSSAHEPLNYFVFTLTVTRLTCVGTLVREVPVALVC